MSPFHGDLYRFPCHLIRHFSAGHSLSSNIMTIILQGLRIYAHHGVLPQEHAVGAYFTVDLRLQTDSSSAIITDNLSDTISYADVFQIVKDQMSIPSQLLEHVAGRIINALFNAFPTVTHIRLGLFKENPPIGAECARVGIEVEMERPQT